MKPMLKKDFYALVNRLLSEGFQPTINWGYVFQDANLVWIDAEGHTQFEPIYTTTPAGAHTKRRRFDNWLTEILDAFNIAAADALEVGDKVLDGDVVRTVTAIRSVLKSSNEVQRTGVIMLDGKVEVMAGFVKRDIPTEEVTVEQLLKASWANIADITYNFSDDTRGFICGSAALVSTFNNWQISFGWKILKGHDTAPDTLMFWGEPRITSPHVAVQNGELMLVLETLDESLNILGTISDKWSPYNVRTIEIGRQHL